MATFELEKGQKFSFEKGLREIIVGVGWKFESDPFDLDLSLFGLRQGSKFFGDGSHALTYANSSLAKNAQGHFWTGDESMIHLGDNRTGVGDDDDETAKVHLQKLPQDLVEVSAFVTIYHGAQAHQHFGAVREAYVRVVDVEAGKELVRYTLGNEFDGCTAVQVGSLVKSPGGIWSFQAVGNGSKGDLGGVIANYS